MRKILHKLFGSPAPLAVAMLGLVCLLSFASASAGPLFSRGLIVLQGGTPVIFATVGTTPVYYPAEVGTPGGNKAGYQAGDINHLVVVVDVTSAPSATITPTLSVIVQHSIDSAVWLTHTSFTDFTGVSSAYKSMTGLARYWRLRVAIGANGGGWTYTAKAFTKELTEAGPVWREFALGMRFDWDSNSWVSAPCEIPLGRVVLRENLPKLFDVEQIIKTG